MLSRPLVPVLRRVVSSSVERPSRRAESRVATVVESLRRVFRRRWLRERRRRQVGRAFDMALEVARILPRQSQVLDVGCGNGFIAHHLSAMLGKSVVGFDLGERTAAPIEYFPYDGLHFPARDQSFDAVLFCYVLHHAADAKAVLREARRVLRDGGLVIVYEDIPRSSWDRAVCWAHHMKWRDRTGACTFRQQREWRQLFASVGFETVAERTLSRWRNLAHPVSRRSYVLRLDRGADEG